MVADGALLLTKLAARELLQQCSHSQMQIYLFEKYCIWLKFMAASMRKFQGKEWEIEYFKIL